MKKYIIFAGMTLLGYSVSQAQESEHPNLIKYGFKIGKNYANVSGVDIEDNNHISGLYGGIYANIDLTNKISFQPELLYSRQGVEFDIEGDYEHAKLEYLNIPLMFQYGISDHFKVELGPQIGILLNADTEFRTIEDGAVFNTIFDGSNYTKSIDVGLNIGGSYHMDNGLNLSIRYNYGLTKIGEVKDIDDPAEALSIDLDEARHSVISVGVGFTL